MRRLILILLCAGAAAGQPLALTRTQYRMRAGERVSIEASQETLDFLRHAKYIAAGKGFAVGPGAGGSGVLFAASLTTKPGDYTITVTATSDKGEERTAAARITVDALQTVPPGASVPPVVLLNGWQFSVFPPNGCPISSSSADTFGSLAQQLTGNGVPVVYFFDNCVEQSVNGSAIEELGATLGQFLNMIQYASGALVPQVDLAGHSMGGLISRSYLAGLQQNGTLTPPLNPQVRKFVEIATPNFGSFLAAEFSDLIPGGTQSAEMVPGSSFLWNLATWNQRGDDLRGVDALAIIGNAGFWEPSLLSFAALANASDGVVSLTSASLGFARDPSRTRIVPYCHIDSSSSGGSFIACSGRGIANVDEAPETGQIVLAFLAGNSAVWSSASLSTTPAQNTYLAQDGGIYFGWENAADQYVTDLTQASFGTVSLESGRKSGSLFYDEFVKAGAGTLETTSKSLGSINCGSVTEPPGFYTVWRCKSSPAISSVTPLLAGAAGSVVQSGAIITINGVGFGATQCSTCQVSISPGTILKISSWSDAAISALLPASTGLVDLTVQAAAGSDAITFIAGEVSVANAASSATGAVAPGEIVAIKGIGLGPAAGVSFTVDPVTGKVDTTLAGTQVLFGAFAAPILYTSAGQVNAVVPYEIAGQSQVSVQVQYQGVSVGSTLPVSSAAPGIFTFNSTGTGPAAALNQNGTLNGASNPAVDGSYVTLYCTGGGQTNPAGVTGSISGSFLKWLVQNVTATIGGQPATVSFDGAAPGYIDGFLQLNLLVPAGVHGTVPVVLTVGGIASPATATLALQ
jgi:uncharacterized protein (TIGR03437 family)